MLLFKPDQMSILNFPGLPVGIIPLTPSQVKFSDWQEWLVNCPRLGPGHGRSKGLGPGPDTVDLDWTSSEGNVYRHNIYINSLLVVIKYVDSIF